jgi:RNA polymerase sigma-70 factor (ECF subfamily)
MTAKETLSDEQLLSELIKGQPEAFTVLYERHRRKIYQLIYKYVHSAAMAEDLTQEVFIKIWNSRSHLDHVKSFNGYLLVSARNQALNGLKDVLRKENTMGEVVRNFVEQRKSGDERLLETDYAAFLQRELSKLPERTREIFRLCRQEGFTYEEVARELGISKNAVKNHMVFSMRVLKSTVEKELGISLVTMLAVVFIR